MHESRGRVNLYWVDDNFEPLTLTDTSGNPQKDFIFFAGQRVATVVISSGNPYYYLSDQIGSTSVVSSGDGKAISWEADYFPYGGVQIITNNLTNPYRFAGYENDTETGYNYAVFRYQSPNLGRFFSPDRIAGAAENPQSWNRYGYVLNNPVGLVDPLGLDAQGPCTEDPINGGISCPGTTIDVFGEFFGTGNSDFGYDSWSGGCNSVSVDGLSFGGTCGGLLSGGQDPGDPQRPRNNPSPNGNASNNLTPKQFKAIKDCVNELYNIDVKNFVPIAPGSNGYFYGFDAKGRAITVETNVTHSSW